MKKISCLVVFLLFSISLAIGQKKGKPTVRKPAPVSPFAEAEKAWQIFLPRFQQAVKAKDYALVKTMILTDVECDSKESYEAQERGESDLGEVCINYWRTTKKEFGNDLDWNDLQIILRRYVQKIDVESGQIKRTITFAKKYNDCSADDLFSRFAFRNGSWLLESFKHGECGD